MQDSTVQLKDRQGRAIKYLRISVTDRCNFRCRYCVPQHPFEQIPAEDVMRYEEMLFVVETLAEHGVERIRVTGGEPLVRKNITFFLKELNAVKGVKEVTLTTNGTRLSDEAQNIADAGVKRLNISLDSLKPDRYKYVTGGNQIEKTMSGIAKAKALGFKPIKINSVVIRGFNDDEIVDFCNFAAENDVVVRFIEFMPIGNSADWKKDNIVSGKEILERIEKHFTVTPLPKAACTGPARNFKLSNGATVGIITPMSEHFCSECDKIRLTADGKLRVCLLSDTEVPIMDAVRKKDKSGLLALIRQSLGLKDDEHKIGVDSTGKFARTMSKIGG